MYRNPSHLIFGEHLMLSKARVQQGDLLGPLLFCLLVRKITEELQSSTNLWYLDDGTICGDVMSVSRDLNLILRDGQALGLELNLFKCERFVYGGSDKERIEAIKEMQKVSPNIRVPSREELSLLGAPLFGNAIPGAILEKKRQLEILSSRLSILCSHQALYLLKNCISFPRLLYVLRSSPAYRHSQELIEFNSAVRSALSMVTNTEMTDEVWMQASLPVKKGGVGVRRTEELALPAYLASIHSVHGLISTIVPSAVLDELIMEPMAIWTQRVTVDPPLPIRRHIQKEWDNPIMEVRLQDLLTSADQKGKARLRAVSTKESGCWLNALPLSNVGNLLDDDSLRIAVSLRLGASICQPHTCRCGAAVDVYGLHGLCCRFSAGRHSRHGSLNEVLRRALSTAGVPAVLEPQGIERVDGKRPDGMTLVPWTQGKALVWDVTCVDTLAQSYVFGSSSESGTAANMAERNKVDKYRAIQGRYHFSPLGFETFGAWGSAAKDLVASVGKRMTIQTGDARCVDFLRQKFSIEIQRGNARDFAVWEGAG